MAILKGSGSGIKALKELNINTLLKAKASTGSMLNASNITIGQKIYCKIGRDSWVLADEDPHINRTDGRKRQTYTSQKVLQDIKNDQWNYIEWEIL